jgi:hypothetical protein
VTADCWEAKREREGGREGKIRGRTRMRSAGSCMRSWSICALACCVCAVWVDVCVCVTWKREGGRKRESARYIAAVKERGIEGRAEREGRGRGEEATHPHTHTHSHTPTYHPPTHPHKPHSR